MAKGQTREERRTSIMLSPSNSAIIRVKGLQILKNIFSLSGQSKIESTQATKISVNISQGSRYASSHL